MPKNPEMPAVFGMGQQFVHELRAPLRIVVGQEVRGTFAERNSAEQVEMDAAKELGILGDRRARHLRRRQLFLNQPIDLGGYLPRRAGLSVGKSAEANR